MPKPTNYNPFTHVRENNRRARRAGMLDVRAWKRALKWFGYTCAYCGAAFSEADHPTIDHVIPLSHGGVNDQTNVLPACHPCNDSKLSTALEAWLIVRVGPACAAQALQRIHTYFQTLTKG